MEHLADIFEREEVRNLNRNFSKNLFDQNLQINTMEIFFTLTNADLELIGVGNEMDRKKILEFIASIKTPIRSKGYRH